MNEAERKFKQNGTVSKRVTVPMIFWEEWEQDCKDSFNNTYHLKMQFDHEFRKTFQATANLLMLEITDMKEELISLREELAQLNTNTNNENTETTAKPTFGSKLK